MADVGFSRICVCIKMFSRDLGERRDDWLGEGGIRTVMATDGWGRGNQGTEVGPPGQTRRGRQSGGLLGGRGAKAEAEPDLCFRSTT